MAPDRLGRIRGLLRRLREHGVDLPEQLTGPADLFGPPSAMPTGAEQVLASAERVARVDEHRWRQLDHVLTDTLDAADWQLGELYCLARSLGTLAQPVADAGTLAARLADPTLTHAGPWLADVGSLLPAGAGVALTASLDSWATQARSWLARSVAPSDPVPAEVGQVLEHRRWMWRGLLTGRLRVEEVLEPEQRVAVARMASRATNRLLMSVVVAEAVPLGVIAALLAGVVALTIVFAHGTAIAIVSLVAAVLAAGAAWRIAGPKFGPLEERMASTLWEEAMATILIGPSPAREPSSPANPSSPAKTDRSGTRGRPWRLDRRERVAETSGTTPVPRHRSSPARGSVPAAAPGEVMARQVAPIVDPQPAVVDQQPASDPPSPARGSVPAATATAGAGAVLAPPTVPVVEQPASAGVARGEELARRIIPFDDPPEVEPTIQVPAAELLGRDTAAGSDADPGRGSDSARAAGAPRDGDTVPLMPPPPLP